MTIPPLTDSRRWLKEGTAILLGEVDTSDLEQPSLLPGWSKSHVVAHVARNADAVGRLLTWARTGVETPMYSSQVARSAEIERDALRGDDVQRRDVHRTAEEFANALETLDAKAWQIQVRSARGRSIRADEIPWMRVKEVWLHAVDLGASVDDLPDDLVDALLVDVAAAFDAKVLAPGLRLVSPERTLPIGGSHFTVTGPAVSLLTWLVGRSPGLDLKCDRELPPLPAWL